MTCHRLLISSAIIFSLQLVGAPLFAQDPGDTEEPWRRDPFRYGVSTQKVVALSGPLDSSNAQPELDIKGILQASVGSYRALINGREVREGDRVGDAQIITISRFSAVVKGMDGTRKIDLFHNQVKWGDQ